MNVLNVFRSFGFQEIAIVDNITAARKVQKASLWQREVVDPFL
jgi:hypothetical protein